MGIKATPLSSAIAGVFSGVVMPLLWPRLGDDTLYWIAAFLLVIALPAHAFVVGFDPAREAGGDGTPDPALLKRVAAWLGAALATAILMRLLAP